ncbi:Limb region 1 [Liparis tanakae]|uniref:Limb region 1 n=1 Tax=Liparis tanakae TaxID=230148 RepID=A0A4Z2I6E3_9TELE|nr:Limb region 1 [Liparis tanakae]
MEEDDVTIREQNFHSQVREYIICFLMFAVLYIVSYFIITRYKKKSDDHEDEDAVVNRISFYLCTFTLAVSGGAVFLLPFSIISNEILLSFPKNYYIQWLNGSLIHVCTPVGLSRMFTIMGLLLVKPTILEDLDEQIYCIHLQEEALQRRLNGSSSHTYTRGSVTLQLNKELDNIRNQRTKLERRKKASGWEKNLLYPIVMLILLAGTTISVLMVAFNILYLLVDETAMPKGSTDRGIGNTSLSTFGLAQAVLEIILMLYPLSDPHPPPPALLFAARVACSMAKSNIVRPALFTQRIVQPDTFRKTRITRFDLLGDFGRFNWLGNFYIVLSYNLLFAVVTTLCLVRKFTSAVREELLKALGLDKLQLSNSPTDPESGKLSANGHQKTL